MTKTSERLENILKIIAIIGDFEVPLFNVTLKGFMIPVELLW